MHNKHVSINNNYLFRLWLWLKFLSFNVTNRVTRALPCSSRWRAAIVTMVKQLLRICWQSVRQSASRVTGKFIKRRAINQKWFHPMLSGMLMNGIYIFFSRSRIFFTIFTVLAVVSSTMGTHVKGEILSQCNEIYLHFRELKSTPL